MRSASRKPVRARRVKSGSGSSPILSSRAGAATPLLSSPAIFDPSAVTARASRTVLADVAQIQDDVHIILARSNWRAQTGTIMSGSRAIGSRGDRILPVHIVEEKAMAIHSRHGEAVTPNSGAGDAVRKAMGGRGTMLALLACVLLFQ